MRAVWTLLLLLCPSLAMAAPDGGPFGLGLGGGLGVSGLSGKLWLGDSAAFQGVVGVWGLTDDHLGAGLDALLEMPAIAETEPVEVAWNLGVGGTLGVGGSSSIPLLVGVSGVAGLEFNFQPIPLDLVLEYRPGLIVVPGVDLDLVNFSGHIRYYF